jgi:DNA-binding LacI/PurR family transcriptional regulator
MQQCIGATRPLPRDHAARSACRYGPRGRLAGAQLAELPIAERPTAVFCANDLLALGVLQEIVGHGLRVPQDMAIVGYDDIEFAAAAAVPLSSVRQPRRSWAGRRWSCSWTRSAAATAPSTGTDR